MLDAALRYKKFGWSVFPVSKEKNALVKWKPFQTRLPTDKEIISWWTKWPQANIALPTGQLNGIIAVDIESDTGRHSYEENFGDIPETISQTTGKPRGIHLFFKHPRDEERYSNMQRALPDMDVRGDGGYVVIAPSVHKNGRQYKWIIDPIENELYDLLDLPKKLKAFLIDGSKRNDDVPKNPDGWINELMFGVEKGNRNKACAKLAGHFLVYFKGDIDQTITVLVSWNINNKPPLEWKEIKNHVEGLSKKIGRKKLSEQLNNEIEKIVVRKYPDGTVLYDIFLTGHNKYATMNGKCLGTFKDFKWEFFALTQMIPSDVKQREWEKKINTAMKEAEIIKMSEDETIIASLKTIINEEIAPQRAASDMMYIDNRIVVINNQVRLKISVLLQRLMIEKEKTTRKIIGKILRDFGFCNITQGGIRYWYINFEQWKKIVIED